MIHPISDADIHAMGADVMLSYCRLHVAYMGMPAASSCAAVMGVMCHASTIGLTMVPRRCRLLQPRRDAERVTMILYLSLPLRISLFRSLNDGSTGIHDWEENRISSASGTRRRVGAVPSIWQWPFDRPIPSRMDSLHFLKVVIIYPSNCSAARHDTNICYVQLSLVSRRKSLKC